MSQTRYDSETDTYSLTVPEGRLDIPRVAVVPPEGEGWWPGEHPGDFRWAGPYVPTGITMVWNPNSTYAGVHGELPFADPFWKILAVVVLVVAALVGIIAAVAGQGTFEPGIKGTFEETSPGVTSCTPAPGGGSKAPTVAGVAAIVASFAAAAALSDAADPHWRGQEATPPSPGERTIAEQVIAEWNFVDEPRAGQPYRMNVQWRYDRFITGARRHFVVDEQQTNIHITTDVQVTTPDTVTENDLLWVKAEFTRADLSKFTGPDLYAFVVFEAPDGLCFLTPLADDGTGIDDQADDGIYTGALSLHDTITSLAEAGQRATGTWRVNVFAQDVNRVAPGTLPHIAARTIGGAFVASAIQVTFDPSLPCPLESQATINVV